MKNITTFNFKFNLLGFIFGLLLIKFFIAGISYSHNSTDTHKYSQPRRKLIHSGFISLIRKIAALLFCCRIVLISEAVCVVFTRERSQVKSGDKDGRKRKGKHSGKFLCIKRRTGTE
jgi:hypothetical protein